MIRSNATAGRPIRRGARRWLIRTAASIVLALLSAVSLGAAPPPPAGDDAPIWGQAPAQRPLKRLSQALALALADDAVRLGLRDAMRASHFAEHKLPFGTFITSEAGRPLLEALAWQLGVDPTNMLARLDRLLGDAELYLPVEEHRLRWTGDGDYYVLVVDRSHGGFLERPRVVAFDELGVEAVLDVVHDVPPEALFVLQPAEADFGHPLYPERGYLGPSVQSPDECHPLAPDCPYAPEWIERLRISEKASVPQTYIGRFWLKQHHDGLGANEIEVWTGFEGADFSNVRCIRFDGISAQHVYWIGRLATVGTASYMYYGPGLFGSWWEDDDRPCVHSVNGLFKDDLIGYSGPVYLDKYANSTPKYDFDDDIWEWNVAENPYSYPPDPPDQAYFTYYQVNASAPDGWLDFYEGNNGSQDLICRVNARSDMMRDFTATDCPNDEARSVELHDVKAGYRLRVYDNSSCNTSDDWAEIRVLKDVSSLLVSTFESSMSTANVQVTYHPRDNLDGKVSCIWAEVCGDGNCLGFETSSNCPQDCSASPPPPGGDDCSGFDYSRCASLQQCESFCELGNSSPIGPSCCGCMCNGFDECPLCLL